MNHLKFIIVVLVIFYFDQLLIGISGNLNISVLLPAVVYLATKINLPKSLFFAFVLGILSDTTVLRSIPIMAVFLILVAFLINYLSKKYLEFRSIMAVIIMTAVLCMVEISLMAILYAGSFNIVLLYSFLANSIVSILVIFELYSISKRGLIGK